MANLTRVPRLSLGLPGEAPATTADDYEARLARIVGQARAKGLDALVVYGDREHAGDMAYLCGVDPRFEEALLVVSVDGGRHIILGNECQAYGPPSELGITQHLYQEFSPQGQLRDRPQQIRSMLKNVGIANGSRIGTSGGKTFSAGYVDDPATSHFLPSFIVDALRDVCGPDNVLNAEDLFLDPASGARIFADAKEIVQFEFASALTSQGAVEALGRIRPGVTEMHVANALSDSGVPHSAHTMVNFGEKVRRGLSSATARHAQLGDAYQFAFALRGALTCRAGAIAAGPQDLAGPVAEYFPHLVSNYFDVMVAWYEALDVGVTSGDVFAAADRARDNECFDFLLNPGHYLHFEEWSNSTFAAADPTVLRSGMVLQADIIPVGKGPFCFVNIEDGIALADGDLRSELGTSYPEFWERVVARRNYVEQALGVKLAESVLPLSNIPLWHTPYVLSPDLALTK